MRDKIIILLSFGTLFIHIRPWMAALQYYDKTRTKTVLTCLRKWLLSSHPWPNMNDQSTIMKETYILCYHPLISLWFFLFDSEKFRMESHTVYKLIHVCVLDRSRHLNAIPPPPPFLGTDLRHSTHQSYSLGHAEFFEEFVVEDIGADL